MAIPPLYHQGQDLDGIHGLEVPRLSPYDRAAGVVYCGTLDRRSHPLGLWSRRFVVLSSVNTPLPSVASKRQQYFLLSIYKHSTPSAWGETPHGLEDVVALHHIDQHKITINNTNSNNSSSSGATSGYSPTLVAHSSMRHQEGSEFTITVNPTPAGARLSHLTGATMTQYLVPCLFVIICLFHSVIHSFLVVVIVVCSFAPFNLAFCLFFYHRFYGSFTRTRASIESFIYGLPS